MKTPDMTYVKAVWSENTGGGTMVDMIILDNGMLIGINDECIVLYPNEESFYDGLPEGEFNFPSISIPRAKESDHE